MTPWNKWKLNLDLYCALKTNCYVYSPLLDFCDFLQRNLKFIECYRGCSNGWSSLISSWKTANLSNGILLLTKAPLEQEREQIF